MAFEKHGPQFYPGRFFTGFTGGLSIARRITVSWACVPDIVDDPIHALLKKLLATNDLVEFDSLSAQLRSMLHERIEQLRKDAKSLKPTPKPERKRRLGNGSKKT
ncbi:MAG TPA: hypothetical protein VMS18_11870 [Candidatus Binatia bacterium]|nr:hypothetical protein [Candidatus Binatia bacterium]